MRGSKVTFIGDAGVGKTSIIRRLIGQEFNLLENSDPLGIQVHQRIFSSRESNAYLSELYDLNLSFQQMGFINQSLKEAEVICIVWNQKTWDSSLESWVPIHWQDSAWNWIQFLVNAEVPSQTPIIFVRNKIDAFDDDKKDAIIQENDFYIQIKTLASDITSKSGNIKISYNNLHFVDVSAKTKQGIQDLENMILENLPKAKFSDAQSMGVGVGPNTIKFKRTLEQLNKDRGRFFSEQNFLWALMILFTTNDAHSGDPERLKKCLIANMKEIPLNEYEYSEEDKNEFSDNIGPKDPNKLPAHFYSASVAYTNFLKEQNYISPKPKIIEPNNENAKRMAVVVKLLSLITEIQNSPTKRGFFSCCSYTIEKKEREMNAVYNAADYIFKTLWKTPIAEVDSYSTTSESENSNNNNAPIKLQRSDVRAIRLTYRDLENLVVVKNLPEKAKDILKTLFPELEPSSLVIDVRSM